MRRSTFVTTAALGLAVAGGVVGYAMESTSGEADADGWPVEALTVGPGARLPYTVAAALDPCPGLTISSPVAAPMHPGGEQSEGFRLGGGHAVFLVCFGPVAENGARDVARRRMQQQPDDGLFSSNPTHVTTPSGEAFRVDGSLTSDGPLRLTDWLIDHGGYTYVVGYLHPADDARHYGEVEAMFASIVWDE